MRSKNDNEREDERGGLEANREGSDKTKKKVQTNYEAMIRRRQKAAIRKMKTGAHITHNYIN